MKSDREYLAFLFLAPLVWGAAWVGWKLLMLLPGGGW